MKKAFLKSLFASRQFWIGLSLGFLIVGLNLYFANILIPRFLTTVIDPSNDGPRE